MSFKLILNEKCYIKVKICSQRVVQIMGPNNNILWFLKFCSQLFFFFNLRAYIDIFYYDIRWFQIHKLPLFFDFQHIFQNLILRYVNFAHFLILNACSYLSWIIIDVEIRNTMIFAWIVISKLVQILLASINLTLRRF